MLCVKWSFQFEYQYQRNNNYNFGAMLRLLIVLFVFAAIFSPSHESCFDEPEVINKNRNNPMQEYYKWKYIEIDHSSEYFNCIDFGVCSSQLFLLDFPLILLTW